MMAYTTTVGQNNWQLFIIGADLYFDLLRGRENREKKEEKVQYHSLHEGQEGEK